MKAVFADTFHWVALTNPADPHNHIVARIAREIVKMTSRPDKEYSMADCMSTETMRREGLKNVLTNDWHFEQEGLRALFRSI